MTFGKIAFFNAFYLGLRRNTGNAPHGSTPLECLLWYPCMNRSRSEHPEDT